MKRVDSLLREFVCNETTRILYINDNATIHKETKKDKCFSKEGLDLLHTVAYSPQLNAGCEKFFSFIKGELENCNSSEFINLTDKELLRKMHDTIFNIISKCSIAEKTFGWYANSVAQWRRCAKGMPLATMKIAVDLSDPLLSLNYLTYREEK